MNRKRILGSVLLSLILVSCGGTDTKDTVSPSGAKSALYSMQLLKDNVTRTRASAPLGLLLAIAFDQIPPSVLGSLGSIEKQLQLIQGQADSESDETFALLQELGELLQIDVPTILNQSADRIETLNRYTASLKNTAERSIQAHQELEGQLEQLSDTKKEDRQAVRDLKRLLDDAIDERNFQEAGIIQQDLSVAEQKLAVTETKEDQTDNLSDAFKDLIEIADERLVAIDENREVLIAGLQVVDLPGIEDLGVLKKEGFFGRDEPSKLNIDENNR